MRRQLVRDSKLWRGRWGLPGESQVSLPPPDTPPPPSPVYVGVGVGGGTVWDGRRLLISGGQFVRKEDM